MQRTSSSRPSHNPVRALKRGKACLTCRFLKIKCDGQKPICGPCTDHPKEDPCEFTDGPGRSRTRQLEETIAQLEGRIRELEDPAMSAPSVTLHDPYATPEPMSYSPTSPFSTLSTLSSNSPTGHLSPLPSRRLKLKPISGSASLSISPLEQKPFQSEVEEPSLALLNHLFETFFDHASECGLFLSKSSIYVAAGLHLPPSPGSTPSPLTPALQRCLILWGAHLTPSETPEAREHEFLLRALADTATNLSSSITTDHPQKVIQTIQAEVLLAYYFFRIGKCLEAKIHANSAATLVLGCGLNKIRAQPPPGWVPPPIAFLSTHAVVLHQSTSIIEEGERINAFWTVFMLCNNLAVATESPDCVSGLFDTGVQIDTPWPLDMEHYKDRLPTPGRATVSTFLGPSRLEVPDEFRTPSIMSTNVKATLLWHRATWAFGRFRPDSAQDLQSVHRLHQLITQTRAELIPLGRGDVHKPSTRSIYLAHALLYGASIRLYSIYSVTERASQEAALADARAMLQIGSIDVSDFRCINPVMGSLWTLASNTLMDEVRRIRAGYSTSYTEDDLLGYVHVALANFSCFKDSLMMSKWSTSEQYKSFG